MKTKLISSVAIAALLTTGAIAGDMKTTETSEAPKVEERSPLSTDAVKSEDSAEAATPENDTMEEVQETASDAWDKTKDAASNAADKVEEATSDVVEKVEETAAVSETDTEKQSVSMEGYVEASNDQIRASMLIGKYVYNGTGENAETVGDVNDVIMNSDGQVQAVVIGVGGFIGIGEKNVAIEYDRISWTDVDNEKTIVIDATRDELSNAPEFGVETATEYETGELEKEAEENTAKPGSATTQ